MPTYNDSGIVLNSYNLQEADKILNIYTKENGLVRAVGKGLRKSTGRFGGKIDQLSCCYFQFARGKNLDVISDCEQINSFPRLRSDLIRLTYAILFVEIVSNFAHEKESESTYIYDLLYSGLNELQTIQEPDLFSVKFILNFLSIHGYKPQLETCVSCSLEINRGNIFYPYSTALGGLLCNQCADSIVNKSLSLNVLKILSMADKQSSNCRTSEDIRFALDLLKEHVDIRAKNKIKSFDLVFAL